MHDFINVRRAATRLDRCATWMHVQERQLSNLYVHIKYIEGGMVHGLYIYKGVIYARFACEYM